MSTAAMKAKQLPPANAKAKTNQYGKKVQRWHVPDKFFHVLDRDFDFTEGAAFLELPNNAALIEAELARAHGLATRGEITVVCFLPCNTDQGWFHKWAMQASEIIWIEGRVRLIDEAGNLGGPPIAPSVILVYRVGDFPRHPRMRSLHKVGEGDYYLAKKHS